MPTLVTKCPICQGTCSVDGKWAYCIKDGYWKLVEVLTVFEY